jgi:hypothetical protein
VDGRMGGWVDGWKGRCLPSYCLNGLTDFILSLCVKEFGVFIYRFPANKILYQEWRLLGCDAVWLL